MNCRREDAVRTNLDMEHVSLFMLRRDTPRLLELANEILAPTRRTRREDAHGARFPRAGQRRAFPRAGERHVWVQVHARGCNEGDLRTAGYHTHGLSRIVVSIAGGQCGKLS